MNRLSTIAFTAVMATAAFTGGAFAQTASAIATADLKGCWQLLRSLTDAQEKQTVHAPAQEYRAPSIG